MAKRVIARIVRSAAPCPHGHGCGEEWDVTEGAPPGFCHWAWNSLYPFVLIVRSGGRFPWQKGDGPSTSIEVACPDPENGQRFRIEVVDCG